MTITYRTETTFTIKTKGEREEVLKNVNNFNEAKAIFDSLNKSNHVETEIKEIAVIRFEDEKGGTKFTNF